MGRKNDRVRKRNAWRAAQRDHRLQYTTSTRSSARNHEGSSGQPTPLERDDSWFPSAAGRSANLGN